MRRNKLKRAVTLAGQQRALGQRPQGFSTGDHRPSSGEVFATLVLVGMGASYSQYHLIMRGLANG